MSDPVPAPSPPIKVVPSSDQTELSSLNTPDVDGNVEHLIDADYYGWVDNGTSWLFVNGQRLITLNGDTSLNFGNEPPAPPVVIDNPPVP